MKPAKTHYMQPGSPHDWDLVITAETRPFDMRLTELWHYRDLVALLVKRDFVAFYKQTILGPLWFFLQPVLTTLMFIFVFGKLAGLSTDGIPRPLFYLAGITAWNYFSECLTKTSTVFKDNAAVFGKVYFPRMVVPVSIVLSNLARFGIQLILFLLVWAYYYFQGIVQVSPVVFLFPVLVFLMALMGLGLGMIISAMTTRYRDLAFLVTFGVQLLMYSTTIAYPLSAVPSRYQLLVKLNPMTSIVETFRLGFLGNGTFSWTALLYTAIFSIVAFLAGLFIFNRVEKNFVDTV